jgi:valyl-tRNA synthetase
MLHPFMPFITEEIWQKIPHRGDSIMIQEFPVFQTARENTEAAQKMQSLMELIGSIRSLRAEMNIDSKRSLDATLVIAGEADINLVSANIEKIRSLARLNKIEFQSSISGSLLRGVWRLGEFGLDVHDAINLKAESERLQKEIARVKEEIEKLLKKLNSEDFLARAPEEIIMENRARHNELIETFQKLESNIKSLPLQ